MALPTADLTEIEVLAIRALLTFSASSDQQRHAVTAILTKICRRGDTPYVSAGPDRDVFVMIGRHQVGVSITSVNNADVLVDAQKRDRGEPARPTPHRKNRRDEKPA